MMPAHGIDESIGALRIEIAAGGLTGTVYADGARQAARHGRRRLHHAAPTPYADQPVLTLDLTGITPGDRRRRQALGPRAGQDRRRATS